MIYKISDISKMTNRKLDEFENQTVLIEAEGCMGLTWSKADVNLYTEAFEFLIKNCIGEKPVILDSWYQKDVALDILESDIELINLSEKLKNVKIGKNYGELWRNHSFYGDQILSLIRRVIIEVYPTHTIYETFCTEEDEDVESIDISDMESVNKCNYTHYYFYKNSFNCIVSCENISFREYMFHHNMRHLLMRMITQQKGMSGVYLGSISFMIHSFNPSKFYDLFVTPTTLPFPSEEIFHSIMSS